MEISFRIADSAKSFLGSTEDPMAAWKSLEKRFSARQQGLQFDHLIPSRGDLGTYKRFAKPVEISAAGGEKIFAGPCELADLRDVYYAPGVHVCSVSLGKLEGQGWDVRLCNDGMELRNRDGDLFANIEKVNNVSLRGLNVISPRTALAACTMNGDDVKPTHAELVERLDKVAMVAMANGADGKRATLLTWH